MKTEISKMFIAKTDCCEVSVHDCQIVTKDGEKQYYMYGENGALIPQGIDGTGRQFIPDPINNYKKEYPFVTFEDARSFLYETYRRNYVSEAGRKAICIEDPHLIESSIVTIESNIANILEMAHKAEFMKPTACLDHTVLNNDKIE